jgi:hypothetical protein
VGAASCRDDRGWSLLRRSRFGYEGREPLPQDPSLPIRWRRAPQPASKQVASQIPPTPFAKEGVGGPRRLSPFEKGGRGDFVPHSSVASPFRAFRVFRSALVPKSLQPSVDLPEQLQAGVSVPGVAGEVTVAFPNETLRGQFGRWIAAPGGFSPTGVRLARRSAGKAYGGLRATDAVSGKLLAFPLLYSSAVAWEQGPRGAPIADRAQRPSIASGTTSKASRTSGA